MCLVSNIFAIGCNTNTKQQRVAVKHAIQHLKSTKKNHTNMSSDEETPLLIDENQCNENNVGSEPLADITTKPGVNDVARKSNADLSTPQVHEYPNGYNHNAQLNDLQPEQAANIAPQSIRRRRALSLDYDISRKEHRLLPNTPNHNNNENHQKDKSRTTPHKHRYSRKKNAIINGKCTRQSLFLPKSQTIRFPSNINEKKYVLTVSYLPHSPIILPICEVNQNKFISNFTVDSSKASVL